MFDSLSEHLGKTLQNLTGKGRLTEENITEGLRDIRMALIEADVALPVVKEFIEEIKGKALGEEVKKSLNPGQVLVKLVNDELVRVLGEKNETLDLSQKPPAIVLMAGLQGSGKTTTVAKLARHLMERENKKVMVTSCDIYRPAAIKQLEVLAQQINCEFFPSTKDEKPVAIAKRAIESAKLKFQDILIIDTAGRLHIDDEMMAEIRELHQAIDPVETLFVVDAMTGQDAANTAKAFHEAIPLTGIILTKADGDARGGAALSIRRITGKPIKFIGVGEKIEALEAFHPERIASRILGMGDIVTLVEEVEQKIDKARAEKITKKIKKGQGFDLQDFLEQLQQMQNMGGMMGLISKLPGVGNITKAVKDQAVGDNRIKQLEAIINSMTPGERARPEIIRGSRKRRIATGSGTEVQDVNRLLKQFTQMQKMMKKFSKRGGMQNMLGQLQGMMPPDRY